MLIVPPRWVDVVAKRAYYVGNVVMWCGLAILFPYVEGWDPFVRASFVALGVLCGYWQAYATVHNHTVALCFRFRPSGEVTVSETSGKQLRISDRANSSTELQRRMRRGPPTRFHWSYALASVDVELSEEHARLLKQYGLNVTDTTPALIETRFSSFDKKVWWFWAVMWSAPWWGVAYRLLFPGPHEVFFLLPRP